MAEKSTRSTRTLQNIESYMKHSLKKIRFYFSPAKNSYLDNKPIANILFAFLIFGAVLWQIEGGAGDFGLNFFTEVLGVVITVLIVDRIAQKREEEKTLPQKLAVYEDVRLLVSRYLSFWLSTNIFFRRGNGQNMELSIFKLQAQCYS